MEKNPPGQVILDSSALFISEKTGLFLASIGEGLGREFGVGLGARRRIC